MGRPGQKGQISENFLADLVVLDKDPFSIVPTDIRHIQVLATFVNGEIIYKR